jgi:hypothetical protein
MAADIEHSDALQLVGHLEKRILADRTYLMTYSEAAAVLKRNPTSDGRHIGQVTSRIDAACFYARTPFLAMHRVRESHGGKINPRSFQDDLWRPQIPALIARAEGHVWAADDFSRIKRALQSIGDDSAKLQWQRIAKFGDKGVEKALGR